METSAMHGKGSIVCTFCLVIFYNKKHLQLSSPLNISIVHNYQIVNCKEHYVANIIICATLNVDFLSSVELKGRSLMELKP